ncbi:MAG: hypothetical protein HY075_04015 [Deltaproteobacteria bacterium]|nr:hypothetical protein [Deltaproteobacteria bacterium]
MRTPTFFLLALATAGVLVASGCGPGDNPGANGDGQMQGTAQYADCKQDKNGQPQEPAKPDPQPIAITVEMSGTGTFPKLQSSCSLDGKFDGSMSGSSTSDSSGNYVYDFNTANAFKTDLGCTIPDLKVAQILSFKVVAKLQNTQQNCKTYCDAQLRASCENSCDAQFQTQQGRATCRSSCEASGSGSCQTQCTGSTTRRITAEVSLSAAALAELNAQRAGLDGVGEVNLDLTFSKVTDGN